MWLVLSIKKDISFKSSQVLGVNLTPNDMPLMWADGMVGALPVFGNKDDALKYADGVAILEIKDAN